MKNALGFILISIFVLILCFYSSSKEMPNLSLNVNNQIVELDKYPYYWKTAATSTHWEYPEPTEISKEMTSIKVKPKSTIKLDFTKHPKNLDVTLWSDSPKDYYTDNNEIIAPSESGNYTISVIGHWDRGEILYILKLSVE